MNVSVSTEQCFVWTGGGFPKHFTFHFPLSYANVAWQEQSRRLQHRYKGTCDHGMVALALFLIPLRLFTLNMPGADSPLRSRVA